MQTRISAPAATPLAASAIPCELERTQLRSLRALAGSHGYDFRSTPRGYVRRFSLAQLEQWELFTELFQSSYEHAYTSGLLEEGDAFRAGVVSGSLSLKLTLWLQPSLRAFHAPLLLRALWTPALLRALALLRRTPGGSELLLTQEECAALEAMAGFSIRFGLRSGAFEPLAQISPAR